MIPTALPRWLPALAALAGALAPASALADPKNQEIRVNLFGQPCTMEGPFSKPQLTSLHEISPEKIPPAASVAQMKGILAKTGQIKGFPPPVEQYRDHLRKRLAAKIALEEGVQTARKSKAKDSRKALTALLTNLKEHVSSLQYPGFEAATKKSFDGGGALLNDAFFDSLRERFEGVIQPDTEEEFHKAIRVAKVQYVCVFDDGEHGSDGDSDAAE